MKLALLLSILLAMAAAATCTLAQDADERCRALAETATVAVVFEDLPITWDTRHRPDELERLHGPASQPNHLVLGLTIARPTARMRVEHRSLVVGPNRACVAGSVVLTLSFSELKVYLASNLASPCRRRVVEEHELEHVRIWRQHLRVGARMLEPILQKQLASPLYVEQREQAEPALRAHLEATVAPLVQQLTAVTAAAQREIDTPESYRTAEARFRACP